MARPQHLVILNDTPVEILASPLPEFVYSVADPEAAGIFELEKKWANVHVIVESASGYDQAVSGEIDVYLYHAHRQHPAYFTTLSVSEDMRCDIALPDTILGAQYICLRRGEGWPRLTLHKLPDVTGVPPDYDVELTVSGDTWDAGGGAVNLANWTITYGATGLTVGSVTRDSDTQVTLSFDPFPNLTVSGPGNGDLDPTITIDLTDDTFSAVADQAANWDIDVGTTGLTLGLFTLVGPNQVTIATTGNCTTGVITITALAAAITSGRISGECTYTIDVAAETSECLTSFSEGTLTIQAEAAAFTSAAEDSLVFTLVTDDASLSVSSDSAPTGVLNAQIMYEGHYGY